MTGAAAVGAAGRPTPLAPAASAVRGWPSVLLGAGLALTSATQLRVPGLPIGPGEVLLLVWVLLAAAYVVLRGAVSLSAVTRAFVAFWGATLPVLAVGWIVGVWIGVWDPASTRDAIAILLAATVTTVLLVLPEHERRVRQALRTAMSVLLCSMVGLGLLAATGRIQIGPITSLYGFRFAGWALNPNQLALITLPLPFFAVARWRAARRRRSRIWALVLLGMAVGVGAATLSDALVLGWAVGAAILGVVWWVRTVRRPARGVFGRVTALFFLPLAATAALAAAGPPLLDFLDARAASSYDEGGQGSDRVARWRNGLAAAERSPAVGMGPGSYSGPFTAFQGEEAHNTLIDWLDSTGAAGVLALVALWCWCGWYCIRARNDVGAVVLASLFVFTMFHFVLRQPVFWFYLVAATAGRAPRARRGRYAEGST